MVSKHQKAPKLNHIEHKKKMNNNNANYNSTGLENNQMNQIRQNKNPSESEPLNERSQFDFYFLFIYFLMFDFH